jgi:hypothetical protein
MILGSLVSGEGVAEGAGAVTGWVTRRDFFVRRVCASTPAKQQPNSMHAIRTDTARRLNSKYMINLQFP